MNALMDQFNAMLARYKFLIWLILGILIAFGFDFKTPATHFRLIENSLAELHRTDTIMAHRIDASDSARAQMNFYLRALMIAQCIDRPMKQTQLMGLPCGELLNPLPRRLSP